MDQLCGAIISPQFTDEVCEALSQHGPVSFADARPGFRGFGEGKSYLHQDAEQALFGKTLPSWMQNRGTCVSQGSGRAIQDAIYSSIAVGGLVGDLVSICFETIYGGSRIQIGRGQLGGGDGSCGAWAAQFMHDFGILKRGVYGSINLESPREDLAVQWGQPRYGVPQSLLAESASRKLPACLRCMTVEDVRDALAARYGVARCADMATDGVRDKDGIRRPRVSGGHCQELCGVYVDKDGDLMFVEQQSWGNAGPKGGGTFKLQDGREIAPREGSCAIYPDDVEYYLRNGEVWAFAPPRELWQTEHVKPSDM